MIPIDTMLRAVLVTLKEEQACLKLWFKDKSVNDDVRRGIEISLTRISEALGKLAALKKGDDDVKETVRQSCKTQRGKAGSTVDAAFGETNVTEERQGGRITR